MPPQPKRNRCVILYDLNTKNQLQLRRALLKIYSHYYFRKNKDLVNLVLVNSKNTKNRKNQQSGRGYQNIFEVEREGLLFDPTFVHDKIEVQNANASNWKEALHVAIQILQEDETPRIITYQILFLTDFSSLFSSDVGIDDIVFELNKKEIFLYIVGPDVRFSKTITNFEELKLLVKDISFGETIDNLIEVRELIAKSNNAVIANVKMGLQFFFNFKNPIGKQAWTVPLTVGSKIEYSVGTSKLMERSKGFQLKCKDKIWNKSVFVSAKDSTKIFAEEDVRRGIIKHAKFVPLANNDMFKVKHNRMFTLVFITKISCIPEYMMKGPGCYTVIAAQKSSPAAFYSLVFRLDALQSCIIAKRVYSKGNRPIYMALLPLPSQKCFRAVELPYGSNIPFEWMEQEPQKDASNVSEPMVDFLNSITIGSESFSLNCPMTPNVVCSSKGEALVNLATEKLLQEPYLHLEEVDYDIFSTGINGEIGSKLREIWPSRGPAEISTPVKDEDIESDNDVDYF